MTPVPGSPGRPGTGPHSRWPVGGNGIACREFRPIPATSTGTTMLSLAHSSTSGNPALLLVILAAVAVVMFWRSALKLGIIVVLLMIVICMVTGISFLLAGLHQVLP